MYTFEDLNREIYPLVARGARLGCVGRSVLGRKIMYLHVGEEDGGQVIVQGAIHAREHISSAVIMRQIDLALGMVEGGSLRYKGRRLNGGIYFIPMLNPDGVEMCRSINSLYNLELRRQMISINGGTDFSLWKANARGVDLNVNFDARWGEGKSNVLLPSSANYIGSHPESEPETRAIIYLTLNVKPQATISYHAKGREIYWQFGQVDARLARDRAIAQQIAALTGYTLVPEGASAGGYKDYCIQTLKIPALTIELVSDDFSHPTPYSVLNEEFEKNKYVPLEMLWLVGQNK